MVEEIEIREALANVLKRKQMNGNLSVVQEVHMPAEGVGPTEMVD